MFDFIPQFKLLADIDYFQLFRLNTLRESKPTLKAFTYNALLFQCAHELMRLCWTFTVRRFILPSE